MVRYEKLESNRIEFMQLLKYFCRSQDLIIVRDQAPPLCRVHKNIVIFRYAVKNLQRYTCTNPSNLVEKSSPLQHCSYTPLLFID